MTVDCQWIEKNLEALSCQTLSPEETRLAGEHIENCAACRREVQTLNAIDPIIKNHFNRELVIARRPRAVRARRVLAWSAAAVAAMAILFFVALRTTPTNPALPPSTSQPQRPPVAAVDSTAPIKNTDSSSQIERTKPANEPDKRTDVAPVLSPAVTANAPEFLVTDPAGYTRRPEDYRGHIVVLGVWNTDQAEAVANLERLYKSYGANSSFRFLGVTNETLPKPANATFPIVYNQGSKLFGAQPGEFVLLDENGAVQMRGSLTKDFDSLRKALQGH